MALQLILFDPQTNQFRKPQDREELERIVAPLAEQFGYSKATAAQVSRASTHEWMAQKHRALRAQIMAAESEELRKAQEQIALLTTSNERLRRKLYGPDEALSLQRGLNAGANFPCAAAQVPAYLWARS